MCNIELIFYNTIIEDKNQARIYASQNYNWHFIALDESFRFIFLLVDQRSLLPMKKQVNSVPSVGRLVLLQEP